MNRPMPPLGMRMLIPRLLVATVASVVAVGLLVGQSDIAELKTKAEQGNADAQYNLGLMYDLGEGVPRDDAEAVKWYRLAAEQESARAQYNLCFMYAMGEGVPRDYVEALKWLNLAAAQSQRGDHKKFSEARDLIAEPMTPQQIAEAQRLAREWKPKTWDELKGLD